MPGLSSSQEMRLEYVTWQTPESLPIVIRRHVMDGIHQEVNDAFAAAPHRGAETGGILLGQREADRIVVEDFEPVPSEHRFGPSYRLSDADRALLQETLDWFRAGAQPGLSVLGFYRSNTPADGELCQEDRDLLRSHFAAAEDLVLLVKPSLMGSSEADFCVRRGGHPAPVPVPAGPPPLMAWPAPRPRLEPEPERPTARGWRWIWYCAAILAGVVGGALGYVWWHPEAGVERIAAARQAPPSAQPVATPGGQPGAAKPILEGTPVVEGSRAVDAQDTGGVRSLLDRWAAALKRGDVQAAGECYAPVVTTYFNRHDVTREAVRQSIRQVRAGNGRLDVYRISGLGITPVSESRAVVTFRKHWQWSGRRRSSGEEEERMTLVRNEGGWQISSEQAE